MVALTTLQRSLDAAAPRFARTPGPADLGPAGPGRRALLLPGFHAQESPPERAGYHYLGNRTTPRAGLPPAGSMLLWAARDDELMLDHVLHIALQPWAHLTQIDSPVLWKVGRTERQPTAPSRSSLGVTLRSSSRATEFAVSDAKPVRLGY